MPSFISSRLFQLTIALVSLILLGLFFSYRILNVPPGLTADEVAFGYNAALLADSGRDETGRSWPIFVLSLDGNDWRQPVTQYYLTFLFKVFPRSLFLMRFSTVLITLASTVLIYHLSQKIFRSKLYALISTFLFITVPLVMIQTHYALDNIMPIPFILIWLYCLVSYHQKPNYRYLIIAAISLGISFYTYKAMRAIVPIWSIVSVLFLTFPVNFNKLKSLSLYKSALIFSLAISPFFLIIPILEKKYAGAIFDGHQSSAVSSLYEFFYPYLSSFDPSFLFITGDALIFHSTGTHGMFLLASLPLFLLGLIAYIRKPDKMQTFLISAFFLAPILYGLVDSVHRASRLMVLIPLFVLISTSGIKWLIHQYKPYKIPLLLGIITAILINYASFLNYYWYDYPLRLTQDLDSLQIHQVYQSLANIAEQTGRSPYLAEPIYRSHGDGGLLFQRLYFNQMPTIITAENLTDPNALFLTQRENIAGYQLHSQPYPGYYLQIPE